MSLSLTDGYWPLISAGCLRRRPNANGRHAALSLQSHLRMICIPLVWLCQRLINRLRGRISHRVPAGTWSCLNNGHCCLMFLFISSTVFHDEPQVKFLRTHFDWRRTQRHPGQFHAGSRRKASRRLRLASASSNAGFSHNHFDT